MSQSTRQMETLASASKESTPSDLAIISMSDSSEFKEGEGRPRQESSDSDSSPNANSSPVIKKIRSVKPGDKVVLVISMEHTGQITGGDEIQSGPKLEATIQQLIKQGLIPSILIADTLKRFDLGEVHAHLLGDNFIRQNENALNLIRNNPFLTHQGAQVIRWSQVTTAYLQKFRSALDQVNAVSKEGTSFYDAMKTTFAKVQSKYSRLGLRWENSLYLQREECAVVKMLKYDLGFDRLIYVACSDACSYLFHSGKEEIFSYADGKDFFRQVKFKGDSPQAQSKKQLAAENSQARAWSPLTIGTPVIGMPPSPPKQRPLYQEPRSASAPAAYGRPAPLQQVVHQPLSQTPSTSGDTFSVLVGAVERVNQLPPMEKRHFVNFFVSAVGGSESHVIATPDLLSQQAREISPMSMTPSISGGASPAIASGPPAAWARLLYRASTPPKDSGYVVQPESPLSPRPGKINIYEV